MTDKAYTLRITRNGTKLATENFAAKITASQRSEVQAWLEGVGLAAQPDTQPDPLPEDRFMYPALSPIINDAFKRARRHYCGDVNKALPEAEPFVSAIIAIYRQVVEHRLRVAAAAPKEEPNGQG